MLQQNSVQNLQYDSDLRISQPPRVNPIVFSSQNSIITSEPGGRRVSVIDVSPITSPGASNSTLSSYLPNSGLSVLENLPSVHIHQTYELNEMLTSISSENRFTVRAHQNEAVFAASEGSTSNDKLLGAYRPFMMHILDKKQQEVLTFRRKFGCRCFCLPIISQNIEIWSPPGVLLGNIRESFSFQREFHIYGQEGHIINVIPIPYQTSCCIDREASFKILSVDRYRQDATITRLWNTDINTYTMNIYFTDVNVNVQIKSLYLAAGLLFEYLFFQ